MTSKERKSFPIGRDAVTGQLMSVAAARRDPAHSVVERMPTKGNGDAAPPKKKR
jgi:hypothetical protein